MASSPTRREQVLACGWIVAVSFATSACGRIGYEGRDPGPDKGDGGFESGGPDGGAGGAKADTGDAGLGGWEAEGGDDGGIVDAGGPLCASGECRRVFISSATVLNPIGGVATADATCQAFADARSLGGTWKAWISQPTAPASSRLTHAVV